MFNYFTLAYKEPLNVPDGNSAFYFHPLDAVNGNITMDA